MKYNIDIIPGKSMQTTRETLNYCREIRWPNVRKTEGEMFREGADDSNETSMTYTVFNPLRVLP